MMACKRCRYGISAVDRTEDKGDIPFVICALLPPDERRSPPRPTMKPIGFCGQFKLSILALFGYGARA